MLNSYMVIDKIDNIAFVIGIEERFNGRTGDIDVVKSYWFFRETDRIGFAKKVEAGNHQYVSGDHAGKEYASQFGLLEL